MIELDEEPTIVVREPDAAAQLALQNNQLTSQRGILSLKLDLRPERRGQHGQDKTEEPDRSASLDVMSVPRDRLPLCARERAVPIGFR